MTMLKKRIEEERTTKIMIICGHPRSGTTLLQMLCNSHPEISTLFEFGNFQFIGVPYQQYRKKILGRLWEKRRSSFLRIGGSGTFKGIVPTLFFGLHYLYKIKKYCNGYVDLKSMNKALAELLPEASVLGDKFPGYVFNLDSLSKLEDLNRLLIYRDCRDVVRSTLEQVRTSWRGKKFSRRLNTAEKVAWRWVEAVEAMERNIGVLHLIRYEDLILNARHELSRLGEWLEVDPLGFYYDMIENTSIGKYKEGLSDDDLATVIKIAGPTMERLGYEI